MMPRVRAARALPAREKGGSGVGGGRSASRPDDHGKRGTARTSIGARFSGGSRRGGGATPRRSANVLHRVGLLASPSLASPSAFRLSGSRTAGARGDSSLLGDGSAPCRAPISALPVTRDRRSWAILRPVDYPNSPRTDRKRPRSACSRTPHSYHRPHASMTFRRRSSRSVLSYAASTLPDDMGERPFGDLARNLRLGAPVPERAAEPVRRRPRPVERPSDGLAGNRLPPAPSGENERRIGLRFGEHPQGGLRQRHAVLLPCLHPRSRDRPNVVVDLGPLRPGDLRHAAGGEQSGTLLDRSGHPLAEPA